jgi:molecular chaperone GrpE
MQHKNIIDELMAHEPTEQKDKPAKVGDSRLDEKLEKAAKEAENLEACTVKSQKNKTKSETNIENLCEEIGQLKNQLLRAAAELQNTQTRAEREINNAHKFALERFSKALLPIADNLERALENTPKNDPHIEGVQLTLQLFLSALEKFGVEQIYPINKPFDSSF